MKYIKCSQVDEVVGFVDEILRSSLPGFLDISGTSDALLRVELVPVQPVVNYRCHMRAFRPPRLNKKKSP